MTACNRQLIDDRAIDDIRSANAKQPVPTKVNTWHTLTIFTHAKHSIARYMLQERGWLGVCHTPVVYQNG